MHKRYVTACFQGCGSRGARPEVHRANTCTATSLRGSCLILATICAKCARSAGVRVHLSEADTKQAKTKANHCFQTPLAFPHLSPDKETSRDEIHAWHRWLRRRIGRAESRLAGHRRDFRPWWLTRRQCRVGSFARRPPCRGAWKSSQGPRGSPSSADSRHAPRRPERSIELQRLLAGCHRAQSAQPQSKLQQVLARDAGLAAVSPLASGRQGKVAFLETDKLDSVRVYGRRGEGPYRARPTADGILRSNATPGRSPSRFIVRKEWGSSWGGLSRWAWSIVRPIW
jgi:hypothetical protein